MEDLIPFAGIAMIVAVVLGPIWLGGKYRSEERARMHETLRIAFDKGQSLPPEIVHSLVQEKPRPTPERDLRGGVIWLAVGLGVAIFGWVLGYEDDDARYVVMGMAAIPALVGTALIVLGSLGRDRRA
jgi:hypothetical protein